MKQVLAVFLTVVSASTALGYSGATVSVFDADVTTPNLTVFPVPAAAGMAGARLVYDNSALLSFSADHTEAGTYWVTLPLVGSGATIHGVNYTLGTGQVISINDTLGLFTNTQGTPMNPRFPTNIPRPGRSPWEDYTAVQFDLAQPAQEFGVFVAMNTNAGPYSGTDDNNIPMQFDRVLNISILGEADTFATAQNVALPVGGRYAPFIKVVSNGTDLIKSVCVVQEMQNQTGAPFGFFDAYAVSAATLPNAPSNPVPANLTDNCRVDGMTLSWASEADVTYDVYLDTNTNPTTKVASDLPTASFAPTLASAGTKHYWKVVAKNSAGSTDGPVWVFRTRIVGDINGDGFVNVGDLQALVAAWGSVKTPPSANWNADADCNADGFVNVGDLQIVVAHWGEQQAPW